MNAEQALAHRVAPPVTAEEFNQGFAAIGAPGLLDELSELALGDQAVPGLRLHSFVTRWDLEQALAELQLGPGQVLLDLACGQGSVGLWLAGRAGCDLVGVDFAESGLRIARKSAALSSLLRSRFELGELQATGLADASVDGVWCADALFFAADLLAALAEIGRVLRPAGRVVMTVCLSLTEAPSAHPLECLPLLEEVGLFPLRQQETPHWRDHLGGMYRAWIEHEPQLRAELPGRQVDELIAEARSVGSRLDQMRRVLVVGRR